MQLCDDKHDEICFEGRHCPICDMQNDLDAAHKEIDDLKNQIDELVNVE